MSTKDEQARTQDNPAAEVDEPATKLKQAPAETRAEESASAGDDQDGAEALRREVEQLREKNLRLIADARNAQQRAQRDTQEAIKYAEAAIAGQLLVILDDLERTRESAKTAENVESVSEGVRIVYEHFLKILRGRHIEPLEAVGKPFDPDCHQAMMQQPSDEHPAGTVIQELARGYKMHERVIRPARVVVSSGPAQTDDSKTDNTKKRRRKEKR